MTGVRYLIDRENLRQYRLDLRHKILTVIEPDGRTRPLSRGEKISAVDDIITKQGQHRIIMVTYFIFHIDNTDAGLLIHKDKQQYIGWNKVRTEGGHLSVRLVNSASTHSHMARILNGRTTLDISKHDEGGDFLHYIDQNSIKSITLFPQHADRAWRARGEERPRGLLKEQDTAPAPIEKSLRDAFWTAGVIPVFSYDSVRKNLSSANIKPKI